MDQMVKQLEDQWHEIKKQEEREEEANWEDVESEEEEEFTYVIGGYEISKEDLLNLLEIALKVKMMNHKRMAHTIWKKKNKLKKGQNILEFKDAKCKRHSMNLLGFFKCSQKLIRMSMN